ncbi:MAG: GNAT family N-acetyltransferase, partial [Anaerolineae bacterium]
AGDLLALRQQFLRATRPELPARFEDPVQAALAVTEAWQRPHAAGVAAFDHDRLVGYLIGDMVFDQIWGRAGWVRLAGCALAPGQAPELIGDLYQMLGVQWVAYGCFHHVALMPAATPDLIGAWFDLSFGIQQVHALASLVSLTLPTVTRPPTLEIRQAGPADRAAVAGMYRVIRDHLTAAPVWGIALPEDEEEIRGGWAGMVDDAGMTVWLALEHEQALSMAAYERLDPAEVNLLAPERCTELVVAATVAAARGRGVGSALTHHGLTHAQQTGFTTCLTDWRSTNLLAARFWPRWGFRPVAYRLARQIDPRIAWANASRPTG